MDGDTAFASWGATGSYDWGSGDAVSGDGSSGSWYDGLFGLANTYLQGSNQVKLQQAANGQRYVEGQPVLVRSTPQGLTLSPGLLLLGGLVAFVLLAKG